MGMKKRDTNRVVRTRPLEIRGRTRSLDDVLDEMAVKWALRAERMHSKTLIKSKG